jgi:hypothetical protein
MTRFSWLVVSFALASAIALPVESAWAQPGAVPVVPPSAGAAQAPAIQHWGFGIHGSSAELTSSVDDNNKIKLGGGGLHVRYRLNHRFSVEVSLDRIQGEWEPGVQRDSRPVTLTGLVHLSSNPKWNWYLLAGFGGSREVITMDGANGGSFEYEYRQAHIHLGAGVEHRWNHFGVGAELRLIGAARDQEYSPGAPASGPVPEESSGGMFSLLGTYYF